MRSVSPPQIHLSARIDFENKNNRLAGFGMPCCQDEGCGFVPRISGGKGVFGPSHLSISESLPGMGSE